MDTDNNEPKIETQNEPKIEIENKEHVILPAQKQAKMHYDGSVFWLIFWVILFFPIALILFFIHSRFDLNDTSYQFKYGGNPFWLMFWSLFFFPITFLLLFLNGCAVVTTHTVE